MPTKLKRFDRAYRLLTLGGLIFVLGCGINSGPPSPVAATDGISGTAYGGRQPIVGSAITVWASGSTGVGAGATSLATTTTNSSGQFNIPQGTYSCSGVTTPLYITAQGGNPGNSVSGANPTGANPNIFLVAALGTCGTAVQTSVVTINEVTTVAAAISMTSYIKASNFGSTQNFGTSDEIGSSSGTGLSAAFTSVGYLANTTTGTSPGASSLTTLATPTIYEMANVLAACVNSDPVSGSTICSRLFAAASPASSANTPTATNTFEVAYYLQTNPTSTNSSGSQIATVYGLASPQSPYQPALSSAPSSWSVAPSCDVPSGSTNVPVPTGCAYFGAWANPAAGGTSPSQVNGYTTALESSSGGVGRTLSLHMHYYGWGTTGATVAQSTPSFPDTAMTNDVSAGRTPVVTWACNAYTTNSAVGGASPASDIPDYNLIVATAQAVKAFGQPMFIRWNWEMNLTSGNKCMDSSNAAAGFISAWQNIYNIFKAQGVTNVSWLWNPAGAAADPNPAQYYPTNAYVDWIGFDGYDKVTAYDFGSIFNSFYQTYSSYGKPILIAETGECQTFQQNYLNLAVSEIAGRSNTNGYSFPMVRGFMYFDAPGQYQGCSAGPWNFDSEGITGFTAMGADPYFVALP